MTLLVILIILDLIFGIAVIAELTEIYKKRTNHHDR